MKPLYAVIENIDANSWLTILAIFILLGISAFFSGSETALTAASRGKLHSMADKGSRGAKRALALTEDTCLLYTSPSPRDATLSRMPSSA